MAPVSMRYLAISFLFISLFIQLPVLSSNSNGRMITIDDKSDKSETVASKEASQNLEADTLYQQLKLKAAGLKKEVFAMALQGYKKLEALNRISRNGILSIVDFSKPSTKRRLYILDLKECRLVLNTLVAHGRNSGMIYARSFSNKPESNKSSLGFYTTLNTYWGEKGYALKLKGEEPGVNDNAYERNIVVHGSDYVTEKFMRSTGHLGRSLGCPAVPARYSKKVIDYIKNGSCLFIYHPAKKYFQQTKLINS